MDLVFVVPGIMGSELYLDEARIWPPKALRNVANPDSLLDEDVVVGDIIRDVVVFGFYSKLLKPLEKWGYQERSPGTKGLVVAWPYNWVRGIPENAKLLADALRSASINHPDKEIVLLAHSMGGLICTYALECLSDADVSWKARVRLLVTFGTPFRGAPESLKNAFGVEGVMGITAADCQRLMADPRFPSAYQLFPHIAALPAWATAPPLIPLTDYQLLDPSGPRLGDENLVAAKDFQLRIHNGTENAATRMFNFCGTTYNTVWAAGKAQASGKLIKAYASKAGDGTVPSWSGRHRESIQFAPLGTKHSTTFGDTDLLAVLRDLLVKPVAPTGPGPSAILLAGPKATPGPHSQPRVSVLRNAISSLRQDVEVEISEPPLGDRLDLAWVQVEDAETLADAGRRLSDADFNTLQAHFSIQMGTGLEFPAQVSIPRPQKVGTFALVGWAGESLREIVGLDTERLDLVWVFEDEGRGETTTGGSTQIDEELGDELHVNTETQDDVNKQATEQTSQLMAN